MYETLELWTKKEQHDTPSLCLSSSSPWNWPSLILPYVREEGWHASCTAALLWKDSVNAISFMMGRKTINVTINTSVEKRSGELQCSDRMSWQDAWDPHCWQCWAGWLLLCSTACFGNQCIFTSLLSCFVMVTQEQANLFESLYEKELWWTRAFQNSFSKPILPSDILWSWFVCYQLSRDAP